MDDFELTIRRALVNKTLEANEKIQLFAYSLGIITERDKDKSRYRIFLELLKTQNRDGLTSSDLARRLDLTRGAVLHHLSKLINAGIIIKHKGKYYFRSKDLATLITELEKEVILNLEAIKGLAREIDREC